MRFANINIIEGTGASQLGIGVVTARIVEIVALDEQVIVPIGSYREQYGVTLSLPSRLGPTGVTRVFMPELAADERQGLGNSAAALRHALESIGFR